MGSKPPQLLNAHVKTSLKVTVQELPKDHPAYHKHSKHGLFATDNIAKGEILGEYTGILCDNETKSRTSRFLIKHSYNVYVDANVGGNEMMYINDYRNIATGPNAKFYNDSRYYYRSNKTNEIIRGRIMIATLRDIKQGEEIVVDYGEGYCKRWGIIEQKLNN